MKIIDLSSAGLYSKLVHDLKANDEWMYDRLKARGEVQVHSREAAATAIEESMKSIVLHPSQTQALQHFIDGAACMVSGQQVGMLGGPMYTLYKIATTISVAKRHSGSAVSVFWIEDNDHDIEEACKAWLYTAEQGMVEVQCLPETQQSRRAISDLRFGQEVHEALSGIENILASTPTREGTLQLLREIYVLGASLNDAFLHLLQLFFGPHGVLFVKASVCRERGFMKSVLAQELAQPGRMSAEVTDASNLLQSRGYHVQAEASFVNVFMHTKEGQRLKIQEDANQSGQLTCGDKSYSLKQLQDMLEEHPEQFSPSVLLRPIVQDSILCTHSFVGGPSELAYLAQLYEAYDLFGCAKPEFILRSGATVVSKRYKRMLDKDGTSVESLFQSWDFIEKQLTDELVDEEIVAKLAELGRNFDQGLEELRERILAMDGSLEGSCGALKRAVEKELGMVEKKVRASARRKHEEQLKRVRECHRFIFPDSELQERKLSPIYFYNEGGQELLEFILQPIISGSASEHYCVDYSDFDLGTPLA